MTDRMEQLLLQPPAEPVAATAGSAAALEPSPCLPLLQPGEAAAAAAADATEQHQQHRHLHRPLLLPPGRDPRLRFMAHMAEPLPHFYRPLAFYVTMEVGNEERGRKRGGVRGEVYGE